jgi:hypothetical protein
MGVPRRMSAMRATGAGRRMARARLTMPAAFLAWTALPRRARAATSATTGDGPGNGSGGRPVGGAPFAAPPQTSDLRTAMKPPSPVRLDRALPEVAAVDPEAADLMRRHATTLTWVRLPFYPAHGLLRAVVLLPQRPVGFAFLARRDAVVDEAATRGGRTPSTAAASADVLPLGGPQRLAAANAAAGLRLTAGDAVEYLRFALDAAGAAPTTRPRLVFAADRIPWWPRPSPEDAARIAAARARLSSPVAAPRVEREASGALRVTAEALVATTLKTVAWRIAQDGRVEDVSASTIEPDLPVVVEA